MINDLVLFIDSQDMPRIPKQLFDEVCNIRVAGVPGPVFRGLLEAFESFLKVNVLCYCLRIQFNYYYYWTTSIFVFDSRHSIESTPLSYASNGRVVGGIDEQTLVECSVVAVIFLHPQFRDDTP